MTTIVIYQVDPKLLLPILSILVKQHTTPVCRVPPADPPFFLECEPLDHPVVMVTKACKELCALSGQQCGFVC